MVKKTNILSDHPTLTVFIGIFLFVILAYLSAESRVQEILADSLFDPRGTSTSMESIMTIVFQILTFLPSGAILAYSYLLKDAQKITLWRLISLGTIIAIAMFVIFSWYNFAVNF